MKTTCAFRSRLRGAIPVVEYAIPVLLKLAQRFRDTVQRAVAELNDDQSTLLPRGRSRDAQHPPSQKKQGVSKHRVGGVNTVNDAKPYLQRRDAKLSKDGWGKPIL